MKLPPKLFSCDMYSIGLYVWLTHHLSSIDSCTIGHSTEIINKHIAMINGLAASDVDKALTHLEQKELIVYDEYYVTINALMQKDKTCAELRGALDGMWDEWMAYRKLMRRSYVDAISEHRQYDKLISECNQDAELAKNMLANAIARKWQGWNAAVYLDEQAKIKAHQNNGTKSDNIGRIPRAAIEEWVQQG